MKDLRVEDVVYLGMWPCPNLWNEVNYATLPRQCCRWLWAQMEFFPAKIIFQLAVN